MKKKLFNQCIKFAQNTLESHPELNQGKSYHWSFIFQNNKLIGCETNKTGSVFKVYGYNSYSKIHSEFAVYKKYINYIKNKEFEILNVRLNKNGEIKKSKPCPCCFNFLKASKNLSLTSCLLLRRVPSISLTINLILE